MFPALVIAVLAQLQPLPPGLTPLDSDEGRRLLLESANRDFFALASRFETQRSTTTCGVASAVMVLNAMPVEAPEVADWAPFRWFTEDNLFNAEARRAVTPEAVSQGGLTVEQLAHLLRSNQVEARAVHAGESSVNAFRREASAVVSSPDDFVVVNFLRAELGQDPGAHWSPLAAYHAASDRFLVLDVARFRYPPYWARTEELFRAMDTSDVDSGKSRGWIVVTRRAGAPARAAVPSTGHRMFRVFAGVAAGIFLLGAAAGALLMRWRLRSRLAAAVALVCLVAFDARADDPCADEGPGLGVALGERAAPKAPCDGGDIEITKACHCTVTSDEHRPWGPSAPLALEMAAQAKVASGRWVGIPFTLRHTGKEPLVLDFSGGSVVYAVGLHQGDREVRGAPCGLLGILPRAVRLTLRPGATVRGKLRWKASTFQHDDACQDLAEDLRPGKYRLTVRTVSGEPPLEADVAVTVTRRR